MGLGVGGLGNVASEDTTSRNKIQYLGGLFPNAFTFTTQCNMTNEDCEYFVTSSHFWELLLYIQPDAKTVGRFGQVLKRIGKFAKLR